jgi:predicted nucleotidyltransferase
MPVRSLISSVLRWPDRRTVDEAVRTWAQSEAKRHPELLKLGYFGSYARGDWGVGSDLDLLAVVDQVSEPFERRSVRWDLSVLPVPADVLVYTKDEWQRLHVEKSRFANVIRTEVVWIFSRRESVYRQL